MSEISARQYGYGGGYGVGGFVECCEGVVDPLFLVSIIAGMFQSFEVIMTQYFIFQYFSSGRSHILDKASGGHLHPGREEFPWQGAGHSVKLCRGPECSGRFGRFGSVIFDIGQSE